MTSSTETEVTRGEAIRSSLQKQIGAALPILEVLGHQGCELHFRGRDIAYARDFLLRAIVLDDSCSADALADFERAIGIASSLVHPNIISTAPIERLPDLAFTVERGRTSRSLESSFQEGERFTFARALSILRDIAAALDYAHAQNVVHGALVPAMIFLREDGSVRVAGFGEAERFWRARGRESAGYVAPERWHGDATADPSADIYALGVIAFELFAGRRRITSSNIAGVTTVDPLPVVQNVGTGREASLDVSATILRATAKRPGARFDSAREFVAMLESPQIAPAAADPQRPVAAPPPPRRLATVPITVVAIAGIIFGAFVVPVALRLLDTSLSRTVAARLHLGGLTVPWPSFSRSSSSVATAKSIFDEEPVAVQDPKSDSKPESKPESKLEYHTLSTSDRTRVSATRIFGIESAVSADTGFIQVIFDGASTMVLIDGVPSGRTPFIGRVGLGNHTVSLVSEPPAHPENVALRVESGRTAVASFTSK